jgi:hypothetical protein
VRAEPYTLHYRGVNLWRAHNLTVEKGLTFHGVRLRWEMRGPAEPLSRTR